MELDTLFDLPPFSKDVATGINQKRQREISAASDFVLIINSFIREMPEKECVSAAYVPPTLSDEIYTHIPGLYPAGQIFVEL